MSSKQVKFTMTADTKELQDSLKTLKETVKNLNSQMKQTTGQFSKINTSGLDNVSNKLKKVKKDADDVKMSLSGAFIKGYLGAKVLSTGLNMLMSGLNKGVKRTDTLNNFSKQMGNLGISADEAKESINYLGKKLVGLPTTLDMASSSVQRLSSVNGNVKASTLMFEAMNNAIIAGGTPLEQQKSALEQLTQAYSKGKPDLMEWRTIMMTMPGQMKQVALSFGLVSPTELGNALRSGQISMTQFMEKLVELNTKSANGFPSLEQQARNASGGIQTALTNMSTAVSKGIADILNTIGQANIASFISGIAKSIMILFSVIKAVVSGIVYLVNIIVTLFSWIGGLFGATTKKAQSTVKVTESLNNNMGAVGGTAKKSLGKAGGAVKKLKKQLGGLGSLDELTNIGKTQSSSSEGGGGISTPSIGGGGGIGVPEMPKLDTSGMTKGLEDVKQGFLGIKDGAEAFGLVIGTLAIGLGAYKLALGAVAIYNALFGTSITLNTVLTKIWIGVTTFATWVAESFGAVMAFLTSPIGLVVVAITAVVAIIILLWNNCEWFRNGVISIWNKIVEVLKSAWNFMKPIFLQIMETIKTLVVNYIKMLISFWTKVYETVKYVFTTVWNIISPIIAKIIEIIMKLIEMAIKVLIATFKLVWETVKWVFTKVVEFLGRAWQSIKTIFAPVATFFKGVFQGAWNGIVSIFKGLYGFFKSIWDKVFGLFSTVGTVVGDKIGGAFKSVIKGVVGGAVWMINKFIRSINWAIGAVNKIPGIDISKVSELSVPSFDVGTDYVPHDMLAMIHKGERITPAKYNDDNWNKGVEMDTTNNLLSQLIDVVANKNLSIDEDTIGQMSVNYIENESRRLGVSIIG